MDKNLVASMIDHAVLKPDATDADLKKECAVAALYRVATVCVKPSHVSLAAELLEGTGVKVSTVIGFPHGSTTTRSKLSEASEAITNGASELDMVMNIGKLLSGEDEYVRNDISAIADEAHRSGVLLKVIIETALLGGSMKITASRLAEQAGADFVKTSTGFNGRGAALEDITIIRNTVGKQIKIKASGGIKTFGQAVQFIEAGCSRLGTSSTEQILK